MIRHGERLRDDQGRQTRIETAGEDLLMIATSALWAASSVRKDTDKSVWNLVDYFVTEARSRIDCAINELRGRNKDEVVAAIGQQATSGDYAWLSQGIIPRGLRDYLPTSQSNQSRWRSA